MGGMLCIITCTRLFPRIFQASDRVTVWWGVAGGRHLVVVCIMGGRYKPLRRESIVWSAKRTRNLSRTSARTTV